MVHELKALEEAFYNININLDMNDISVRDSLIIDSISKDLDNLMKEFSLLIRKVERFEANLVKQKQKLSRSGISINRALCNISFSEDRSYLINNLIIINNK